MVADYIIGGRMVKHNSYIAAAKVVASSIISAVRAKICPFCGRAFKTKGALARHLLTVESEKLFRVADMVVEAVDSAKRFTLSTKHYYYYALCGHRSVDRAGAVLHIITDHYDDVVPEELKQLQSPREEIEDASIF